MKFTGEQALALHDLITGPCFNQDIEVLNSIGRARIVLAGQDEYLIYRDGQIAIADEYGWKAWERD